MASEWDGLLLVVIFVAVFAVLSVSTMAIYFFCKCHRKKKKKLQIRPTLKAEREVEEEEQGTFVQRERRNSGLHWVTSTSHDSPRIAGIGGTYMAPRRPSVEAVDYIKAQHRVNVDNEGNYDSNYKIPTNVNVHSKRNNQEPKMIDDINDFVKVFKSTKRLDTPFSATKFTGIQNILQIENQVNDDEDDAGGIFRKPQRIRVRDSTSRGSNTNSIDSQWTRKERWANNVENNQRPSRKINNSSVNEEENNARSSRTVNTSHANDEENNTRSSRTMNTSFGNSPYMFTASSKMAWIIDP